MTGSYAYLNNIGDSPLCYRLHCLSNCLTVLVDVPNQTDAPLVGFPIGSRTEQTQQYNNIVGENPLYYRLDCLSSCLMVLFADVLNQPNNGCPGRCGCSELGVLFLPGPPRNCFRSLLRCNEATRSTSFS